VGAYSGSAHSCREAAASNCRLSTANQNIRFHHQAQLYSSLVHSSLHLSPLKFVVSIGLAAALLLSLLGCTPRETPVEVATRNGTLLLGNAAEPNDLDPHLSSTLTGQVIINSLFEGLTVLDEASMRPLPAAAESWKVSSDGLTWTFHLRPDLRWSNGDPLTAADFVRSWKRALTPALAADNAWYLFALKNAAAYNSGELENPAEIGARAPDTYTLVLTLEHPAPYLPVLLSLPAWFPLHAGNLEKFGALTQRGRPWTRPSELISNGPYTLTAWEPDARIVLEKNPQHRDAARTQIERIVFLPIENADDEERAYRAGQLHATFTLPVTKISTWRKNAPAQLRIDPLLQSHFLRINTAAHPTLADAATRRALSTAIDRELLARSVLQSSRRPATSLVPPMGDYRPASIQSEAAIRQSSTTPLPKLELIVRNDALMPRVAEALQAMWKTQLGLDVSIIQLEQKTWVQRQQAHDYQLCLSAWTADYPDPLTFLELFLSDSPYNWTGWASADYDALLTRAAHTNDPTARLSLLRQAEALLLSQAPIVPLYFGAETRLVHPSVKNWTPAPLGFRRFQRLQLVD